MKKLKIKRNKFLKLENNKSKNLINDNKLNCFIAFFKYI